MNHKSHRHFVTRTTSRPGSAVNPGASPVSRREVLRSLAALTAGAALLPLLDPRVHAAGPPPPTPTTTEPTGNPGLDQLLTRFQFAPPETNRLSDSLALLSGPGGNVAVLAGPGGVLLVDVGIHPTASAVAKVAEMFAGLPVATVVNTHWHFDHAGGNGFFGRRGARIIAQDNVRARMSHPQAIELLNYTFPAAAPEALPSLTFPEELTLYQGDEMLHLRHVPPAHTDGDTLVHFTRANVLHTGDVFFHGSYPFIDYSTGGWIGGMVAAEDRALALCDAQTRVIPGHGPLATPDDLRAARGMLATVQGRIEALLDAGKSVDAVVATAPTADFDARWGHGMSTGEQFARNAAVSILRHRQEAR